MAYGQDSQTGQWICPIRQVWGLRAHQVMTPALEDKICYTAVETLSYERASKVAAKWGVVVDDATVHQHVQKAGAVAGELSEARVKRALSPQTRAEVVKEAKQQLGRGKFSLIIMADAWMIRERGEQWGLKPPEAPGQRVEWHEVKAGIIFRSDQRARTQSDRPMILEKFYVAHRCEAEEFGGRLYAEALRRGLNQASQVYVVADGGVWIWNIAQDRFSQATGVLDYYHASQHLWAVAREMFGEGSPEAKAWIEPLLHQLKHGGEAGVIKTLEDLVDVCRKEEETALKLKTAQREWAYFQSHKDHVHYQKTAEQGIPIGSGAMESCCAQQQNRFKRTGQFWSLPGERRLMTLELANRNQDWDEIWSLNHQQT